VGVWPALSSCFLLPNLGESGSSVRVKCSIPDPVPPMLLASFHPQDDFSIKGLGARIILWPMDLPCHRCVLIEAAVDGRIVARRGRVLWIVVDVGRRLTLVGQSPCLGLGMYVLIFQIFNKLQNKRLNGGRNILESIKCILASLFQVNGNNKSCSSIQPS